MADVGTSEQDEAERRIAPRTRTLKRARVLFNNRFSTIDCVVRNVSRTGALLTVETAVHLPKTFEISVGGEEIRPARLVYRREMFAGIRFLDVEPEEDLPQGAGLAFTVGEAAEPDPEALAEPAGESAGEIHRIVPEPLPKALVRNLPWSAYR